MAFLFPGQGAQSPGMLRELAVVFPEVRQAFEEFDRVLAGRGVPAASGRSSFRRRRSATPSAKTRAGA